MRSSRLLAYAAMGIISGLLFENLAIRSTAKMSAKARQLKSKWRKFSVKKVMA